MSDTPYDVIELITRSTETAWFDLKGDYYSPDKKSDMLHDILSMANTITPNPRLIVCGVTDDRNICGISKPFYENNFWTDIRSFPTNHPLPVEVETFETCDDGDAKLLVIIKILDSQQKPFFLTRDFEKNGKIIRAGVVYGRSQSNNTPRTGTLADAEVMELWKVRFGLHLSPANRVLKLVQDVDRWINTTDPTSSERSLSYHADFPEFTLEMSLNDRSRYGEFWEPWMERITDAEYKRRAAETSLWDYHLRYHGTRLRSGKLMHVRHTIMPMPKVMTPSEYEKPAKEMNYSIELDTLDYFVSAICVSDCWQPDAPPKNRLSEFDYRILEDTSVMFPSGVFHVARRRPNNGGCFTE
ncbi:ATP-binding protein [Marivita sp. S6314]|uniref:AlbA family DNA-binding domain-containing protein n=1 Tax=Marivita sp. S6314 TaxID=2926406 RepID=UPI001FF37474|nr:ATP-binding protein [Marivita sp. S6314]MCK0150394.1 ATP-binding protein [Marivita sp. S6314]